MHLLPPSNPELTSAERGVRMVAAVLALEYRERALEEVALLGVVADGNLVCSSDASLARVAKESMAALVTL